MPFDAAADPDKKLVAIAFGWKNRIITRRRVYYGPLLWPTKQQAWRRARAIMAKLSPDESLRTMEGILIQKQRIKAINQVRWKL